MCSCGGWNWDWRTTCLGCGYAAPPWALDAAAKAKPQADKDGRVDQPRGRRAQRQARSAATSAATSKSQTSASGASGAPSGSGATAIERLQVAVEQLEALQAEPPDEVDCCFADVVGSQLEAKRAELAEAQRAAAEQKAASMPLPLPTTLHKGANAISKAERRLRAARQSLAQKQEARGLVEAQLQKAREELAQLDAEVEEASRALHALEEEARVEAAAQLRQRAAEWAGASQVPGPLMQLDKLPEAWGSSNFEVARAAIRPQVEAVRAQLAEAPVAPRRAPWAESRPMDEISSEDRDRARGCRHWQPQCAAERGQAERRGDAHGRAATAAQDVRCGLEFGVNGNAWRWGLEGTEASGSRSGAPPRLVAHQEEGPLASSGGVAGWRQGWSGVTAPAASDLQLLACSLHLRGALGPNGFDLDSFAAFGDSVLYQRPRFIPFVGMATETFSTNGAGLAGRACSLTVAKPPGLATLHAAPAGGRPLGLARNVDGDIALQAVGTERLVAAWCGGAGLGVARRLRGQHPSLSAAKTTFLAPSPSPGCQLGACGKSQGGTLCETLQARLDPIHKAGPAASGVRGRAVTGNADGELHSWRRAASRSAGALPMGAERGLRMRYAELRRKRKLDPAALRAGHAAQTKTGLLQAGELPPMMMERGLGAAKTRHARTDGPWKHCASPFDAEMLTHARVDGHFKSERCMSADLGDELNLTSGTSGLRSWDGRLAQALEVHPFVTRRGNSAAAPACWGPASPTRTGRRPGSSTHGNRGKHAAAEQTEAPCGTASTAALCTRHSDEKLNGKLYLDGATLEPLFGAWRCGGGATAHRVGDGNLVAGVHGAVGSDRCPQRTAKDGEGVAAWMLATLARPAVEEVNIDYSRHAVLDGRLAEAQRRGNEHASRLAVRRAQTHAADKRTAGVHQAQAGFVQELGRWIWWAVIFGQGIEARGNSSAAVSASAVAFSILGHALSYACAGEGEDTQELVACSKCGTYMALGGRSGVKPRLKERCPGDKTDKGGRNQRSLWLRGLHPGGRRQEGPRAARHRVKGEGIPTLRSQGPVPEHAQERYLEWFGTAAEPAADPSATAGGAGSAPAAAAEPRVVADPGGGPSDAAVAAAAASLPKRRPAAAREGSLGELGVVDEELAAAAGPAGGALEGRRVRRRMARRGGLSVNE
ncbi:unnamed protein product [Prorocentrum cordatum]|uniref:RanBP2-type domain-containing protein n=1 Tax=Prorocentrum cordatum TaxID=2364126 RepID=A0ABN9TNG3_9DINO|nr:unnamed protein product [Polarella glacialis]